MVPMEIVGATYLMPSCERANEKGAAYKACSWMWTQAKILVKKIDFLVSADTASISYFYTDF